MHRIMIIALALATCPFTWAQEEPTSTNTLSVHFTNTPIKDVLDFFQRSAGIQLIYDSSQITGNAKVNLEDVEWEPALRVILDTMDAELQHKGHDIYLITPKHKTAEQTQADEETGKAFASLLTGAFVATQMNAMASSIKDPAYAEALATFSRNYYEALVAKGFSTDQAFRLLLQFDPTPMATDE